MNYETLYNHVRSSFKDLIATPNSLPTHYDNDLSFTQPDNDIWARLTLLGAEARLLEIGQSKRTRHHGLMVINIFTPLGMGDVRILQLGDLIEAAFGSKVIDGVTYRAVTVVPIGRDEKWWVGTVDAPFHADALS